MADGGPLAQPAPRILKRSAATLCAAGILLAAPHETRAETPPASSPRLIPLPIDAERTPTSETTRVNVEPIVRAGRTLPGFMAEAFLWDDRLSFSFSESYGRDLVDGRRVLTSRQLGQGANWRREAGFSFAAPNDENVTLGVTGGLYDARRPAAVRHRQLRLGEVEAWGEHRGADLGVTLGLLGGRLRYDGGYARSHYVGTADYREVARRPERWAVADADGPRGGAQRHRVDADLLTGGPVELSAYGLYQGADPSFRAASRSGAALGFTIGQIRELGASVDVGGLGLGLTRQDRTAPGREQQEIEGEIAYGPVTLSLFQRAFARGEPGAWRSRDDTIGSEVQFNLDGHRYGGGEDGSFSIWQLLPSTVTVGTERGRRWLVQAPDDPRRVRTALSLGLSWGWDSADTDIAVYRALDQSRSIGPRSGDETEFGLDFSQSFYRDGWDLSAYLSLGGFASHAAGSRSSDRWASGGLSFSYFDERLPAISLSVNFDRFDSAFPEFDEHYGERILSLDLAVDLSKYLPDPTSMWFHYYALGTKTRDSYSGRSLDLQHAVGMTMAVQF